MTVSTIVDILTLIEHTIIINNEKKPSNSKRDLSSFYFQFCIKSMARVSACPKSKTDVKKAGEKNGCGKDKYGNNQYMCLPNEEKTSLVEFCYDRVMGIEYQGNNFYTFVGHLSHYVCSRPSCVVKPALRTTGPNQICYVANVHVR